MIKSFEYKDGIKVTVESVTDMTNAQIRSLLVNLSNTDQLKDEPIKLPSDVFYCNYGDGGVRNVSVNVVENTGKVEVGEYVFASAQDFLRSLNAENPVRFVWANRTRNVFFATSLEELKLKLVNYVFK